ncbi:MAG TPA: hypothetical protein VJX94_16715 [Stellaceae bacterium]|nr:hypothetical protein [Stellaceae bacterium]
MKLTMVSSAQRDSELIAHLAPEGAVLREAKVMGIRGLPAANQAGLRNPVQRGHPFQRKADSNPVIADSR